MKALLIDHDDSFTYNLRSWLSPAFSVEVRSHRDLEASPTFTNYNLIVLSPGPKSPKGYPHVKRFIEKLKPEQKVFGVCLGMQIMNECFKGEVQPYTPPLHGKKSKLSVTQPDLKKFDGLNVARYHSLQCLFPKNSGFKILALSENDKIPMWVEHQHKNWMGFQFHPESFLTEKSELFLEHLTDWCRR